MERRKRTAETPVGDYRNRVGNVAEEIMKGKRRQVAHIDGATSCGGKRACDVIVRG